MVPETGMEVKYWTTIIHLLKEHPLLSYSFSYTEQNAEESGQEILPPNNLAILCDDGEHLGRSFSGTAERLQQHMARSVVLLHSSLRPGGLGVSTRLRFRRESQMLCVEVFSFESSSFDHRPYDHSIPSPTAYGLTFRDNRLKLPSSICPPVHTPTSGDVRSVKMWCSFVFSHVVFPILLVSWTEAAPTKDDIPTHFEPEACDPKEPVDLLILMRSTAGHAHLRSAIRATYGTSDSWEDEFVKVVFLLDHINSTMEVGRVYREHVHNDDIIQDPLSDAERSYDADLYRSGLEWAKENCGQAQFLLLAHDENFVNVPALLYYFRDELEPGRVFLKGCSAGSTLRTPFAMTGNLLRDLDTDLFPDETLQELPRGTQILSDSSPKRFDCIGSPSADQTSCPSLMSEKKALFTLRMSKKGSPVTPTDEEQAATVKKIWERRSECQNAQKKKKKKKSAKKH
ncbi:unnamed protein product [Cyprideis torosa]|uniref:Hexosyltransferase n=1 Tax=Cyprideis torosa TaxID=163714 RepID=A0A7R8WC25_9CRUS|nr:unnamed protein product [Cyprideis torosa]CAG0892961.1 unnamed protein product [Cyprideis torosa]